MTDSINPLSFQEKFIIHSNDKNILLQFLYDLPDNIISRVLRGKKMLDTEMLMNEFGAALQFPESFGENWHALEELLCYMDEWLPAIGYVLIFTNSNHILSRRPKEYEWFIKVMSSVSDWWDREIIDNGRFNRPSCSFKCIMQCDYAHQEQVYRNILQHERSVTIAR